MRGIGERKMWEGVEEWEGHEVGGELLMEHRMSSEVERGS